jgi:hypothetical protein
VRLLLDTGASSSMVSPALAERLGLAGQPMPAGSFDLAGGGSGCDSLRPRRVSLPGLKIGNDEGSLSLDGLEALLLPVEALPQGIDGVLGAPTLRLLPVQVDPPRQRLEFGSAALVEGEARQPAQRVLRWKRGVPLMRVDTAAGPVDALADTGAEGFFLSPALARRLPALGAPQPLQMVGVCGEQPVQRRTFGGLRFPDGSGQRSVEGIVTENPIFRQLGVDAILGQELLRQRRQRWRLDRTPPHLELW